MQILQRGGLEAVAEFPAEPVFVDFVAPLFPEEGQQLGKGCYGRRDLPERRLYGQLASQAGQAGAVEEQNLVFGRTAHDDSAGETTAQLETA